MMVAAMIMGYMAYSQTFNGALLGSFLVLIVAPATLLGFIPVVGPALLYFWAFPAEDHWARNILMMPYTWFDSTIMWIALIISIVFTALATFFIIGLIRERKG